VIPRLKLNIYPRYVVFNSNKVAIWSSQQAALLRLRQFRPEAIGYEYQSLTDGQ
jgi:hypothetical protein